ncbi:MAG: hypothetical protein HYZ36_07855, partial [Pedosphaera parvula]|nr:hypothetical protein [Pedosphaera parvula]
MLRHNLYYLVKPFIPRTARLIVRGAFARRRVTATRGRWPTLPGAGLPPADWPGWPDGRPFAVVLTHDVEGAKGLAQVRRLAELEMSLGFRSSFNFVPAGEYTVPAELRAWLAGNGFEVGVHDYRHDGTLYRSETDFRSQAPRINEHLKAWDAVGFRAGFMFHNLKWLRQLDILYDASTFDTDPFEPQPDGAETIFPFFVPKEGQRDQRTNGRTDSDPTTASQPVPSSLGPLVG